MFDWLRKLFRKKLEISCTPICANESTPDICKGHDTVSEEKRVTGHLQILEYPEGTTKEQVKADITLKQIHSVDDLRKHVQRQRIAKLNEERQKATMGYGLKQRNFKPRPASEKQLWKLDKKMGRTFKEDEDGN